MSKTPWFPALARAAAIRIAAATVVIAALYGYFVYGPMQSQVHLQSTTLVALERECGQKLLAIESLRQKLSSTDQSDSVADPLQFTAVAKHVLQSTGEFEPVQQPHCVLRLLTEHNIEVASLERSKESDEVVVRFSCSYAQAQASFRELAASSQFVQVSSFSCQADQDGGGDWQFSLGPVERVQ